LIIKKLEINGFRNLNNFSLQFGEKKNLIFGDNGSGKTSVIEALFLLGFGRSFLPVNRKELVNFDADGFFLHAKVLNKNGENDLSACLDRAFSLRLNGEKTPLVRIGHYLYPLLFSHFGYAQPIDHVPQFRKMIDRFIYGLKALYFHDVLSYNSILKQKNYLLKTLGKSINNSELNSWNSLLAEAGCKIIEMRMAFVVQMNRALDDIFAADLEIKYHPAVHSVSPLTPAAILDDLDQAVNSEIGSRRALIGPHRDRFEILISGKRLQLFSSGEKKKYLIMVHMAFVELFRRGRGDYPVFLIDDYDAAMDEKNLEFMLDHFPAMQVIATSVARNDRFGHLFELKKEN
jgi:DNA replication and repair protein RecF